ncbi:hypothetical protein NWF34_11230 [Gordonia sp. GONU]|uniref:hypothetical protein n=1 Tax=Gordonia sp. GONU TaxID=2972949 RepID=UPI0021AC9ACF|nr:hypothetical protein [Gordonia sp. GONU]MCR8897519.1 hypothetical protein [Gordonia sp. GONU]
MRAVAGSAEVPETGRRPPALPTRNSAPAADVLVIGRPGALTTRLRRVLRERGLSTDVLDVRSSGTASRDDARDAKSIRRIPVGLRSCVAVLDPASRPRRAWWDRRGRRLEKQHEDALIDAVLDAASNSRKLALLVIAEASTSHETGVARERARHVARAADYESAINGNPLTSAFYLVTSAADRSSGAFPAIVDWAQRRPDL